MPIYYNTSSPTPNSKNTINSVMSLLPNIRDFLLNLNLRPTQTLPSSYSKDTSINGSPKIGEPVLDTIVNTGSNRIPLHLPLETEGLLWLKLNSNLNTFPIISEVLQSVNLVSTIPYVAPNGKTFDKAEWPLGSTEYPRTANESVDKYGLLAKTRNADFKLTNVAKNIYLDVTKQIDMSDFLNLEPVTIKKQITGYLDKYGALNIGNDNVANSGFGVKAANVAGSILNGQGLGLAKGGLVTNFDLRSSLAGRVLGASGLLSDTDLGKIGAQQLALALANNAAFNVQQEIIGKLNVKENVLSLIKGEGFAGLRKNYKITVPDGIIGKTLDYAGKILGFTLPRSYMKDDGSIFQSESGEISNIDRAKSLIDTTGKGQRHALNDNIKASLFGTNSKDGVDAPSTNRDKKKLKTINSILSEDSYFTFRVGYGPDLDAGGLFGGVSEKDSNVYAFTLSDNKGKIINLFNRKDKIIPDLSYLREEKISNDFKSFNDEYKQTDGSKVNDIRYSWVTDKEGLVNTNKNIDKSVVKFITNTEDISSYRKSLLFKTQVLFNSIGMKNIVTRKGNMGVDSSQIMTSNGGGISKGSAVLSKNVYDVQTGRVESSFNEPEDVYCRSWTTYDRYDTIDPEYRSGLIRGGTSDEGGLYGSDGGKVPFRLNTQNTVLEDTGFVKVVPYREDFINPDLDYKVPRQAKNYMFSIENLAWSDKIGDLPKGEQGLGDPLTNKVGRIMWFPPYDIQFSESVSVDWEPHKFIGRGENIYTYNNTERTGQLSFKIIIDHSTYTNTFRNDKGQDGPDDNYIASFMAGCIEPDSYWTNKFTSRIASKMATDSVKKPREKKAPPKEIPPTKISVYFPNDRNDINSKYESGLNSTGGQIDYNTYTSGFGLGEAEANFTYNSKCSKNNKSVFKTWNDGYNWGLNGKGPKTPETIIDNKSYKGFQSDDLIIALKEYIPEKCPHCIIKVTGYASPQGKLECNKQLADARAEAVIDYIKKDLAPSFGWTPEQMKQRIIKKDSKPVLLSESTCKVCPPGTPNKDRYKVCPPDTIGCKIDRRVEIEFEYDEKAALNDVSEPEPCVEDTRKQVTKEIKEKFYNETMFFDKLKKSDKFIFDKFREKIKFFHPAFHSTTPEGFNSRLTFLHQCTRQGPTSEERGANNLAFGRAPVCILRIGDFFYTKIVIDSLNIDYEPLVWDLNPEGVGVQPMIANVSLSFKFIGAESLYGPINKLQNALSFNYYANAGVYEARADFLSEQKNQDTTVTVTDDPTWLGSNYAQRYEVTFIDDRVSKSGLYFNNGRTNIFPEERERPDVVLSRSNSCEVDQQKANDNSLKKQTDPLKEGISKFNDSKKPFKVKVNSIGSMSTGIFCEFKGDFSVNIDYPELENEYDAKLIIYDKKMKPYEVGVYKLLKTGGPLSQKTPTNLSAAFFEFFNEDDSFRMYQGKLEIVGLKSVSADVTAVASNLICQP